MDCVASLRPMHCELAVLSRPDGSAMCTLGNTAVIAAVYGPVEVKPQRMLTDRASVEAIYRPKTGLPCVADRMKEDILKKICETALLAILYPRTSIMVIFQEMEDNGGLLACTVNSACLALMNSGISLKFLIAAVSCMIDEEDKILLDPDTKQLKTSKAAMTFVFESKNKLIVASHTVGYFSQTQYQECLLQCKEVVDQIFTFYRDVVKKYVGKS